jgi:hypothetical protein
MKMTWLGVASLLSMSLSVGCSTGPAQTSAVAHDPIQINAIIGNFDWASTLVMQASHEPRQLPPAVMPPGPSYACALCPTGMGPLISPAGWELAGRPDPVELASSLGAPELASAISDRIVDAEIALSQTAVSDQASARTIVSGLAADLDRLAQLL